MFVPYNLNIPFATNSPSSDQPLMEANTNAVNTILGVDHYSFNDVLGGLHQQVTLPTLGAKPTAPTNTGAAIGSIYTNTVTRSAANTTEVFYVADATGNPYQITQQVNAQYATFGTFTNYPPIVANQFGGWTFLPGGLILQYGTMVTTAASTPVVFPFAFNTLFNLLFAGKFSVGTSSRISTETTSGFLLITSPADFPIRFWWQAIGN